MIQLPSAVQKILTVLNRGGYEGYVVGGCVRDSLLGRIPSDWDVTTSALPEESLRLFRDYHVVETGMQHGTITVVLDHMPIEITTYRVDGTYTDHRHPDAVHFTRNLTEDLARRDFTVNAMAYHPAQETIDPFGGQKDLQQQILRCVGVPQKRFEEDALRILRAVRFAAVLGFTVEKHTAEQVQKLAPLLTKIAAERVWAELKKLICGKAAAAALMQFPSVFAACVPAAADLTADPAEWESRVKCMAQAEADVAGRLACLLRGTDARAAMLHLRAERKLTDQVETLTAMPAQLPQTDRKAVRSGLAVHGPEIWQLYLRMFPPPVRAELWTVTDEILRTGACYSLGQLAIDGQKLMAVGIPRGKSVGQALQFALQAVIDERLPNEEQALLQACLQAEQNNFWHENLQK